MKSTYIIKKAILSEKAYKNMEASIYSFSVDQRSTKDEIKKIVEKQFSVKVKKVNVSKAHPKSKKISKTRKFASVGGGKKALVYLEKGQNIELLSPKTEKKEKKLKENKEKKETKK